MSHPLSHPLATAIRAVVTQLRENPQLWGILHLGPMLREHLPAPAHGYLLELRGVLGLSGMGSLKDWGDGLTVDEVVKELTRLLGSGDGARP